MKHRLTQASEKVPENETTFSEAHDLCRRLCLPLARILLRQGVTAHEFGRIADRAFVAAAVEVLTAKQQEPSYSRIATLTGLNRHAVAALAEAAAAPGEPAQPKHYQRNRLSRVLSGWFDSPAYTDAEGKPRVLPLEGPAPSFAALVRQFSGDIYAGIILDELLRVKAVRMTRDGRLRALSRRFTAAGADPDALRHLGAAARDLLATLEHNLSAGAEEAFFEDSALSANLPPEAVPLLRQMIARRGAAFLEDVEGWLAQHERPAAEVAAGAPTVRAGVAVHMVAAAEPASAVAPAPKPRRRRGRGPA
jgi:hypothetical protein